MSISLGCVISDFFSLKIPTHYKVKRADQFHYFNAFIIIVNIFFFFFCYDIEGVLFSTSFI